MAHSEPVQGNQPGQDPSKFGLKFDGEKGRWELMPDDVLFAIVNEIKYVDESILLNFNQWNIINRVYELTNWWRRGVRSIDGATGDIGTINYFARIAFYVSFLIRGRSYTREELDRSDYGIRWDLLDPDTFDKLALIYSYGACKYADDNWKSVAVPRYYAAFMRHFKTIFTKSRFDDESGYLHMYHALWNAVAIHWFHIRKI